MRTVLIQAAVFLENLMIHILNIWQREVIVSSFTFIVEIKDIKGILIGETSFTFVSLI